MDLYNHNGEAHTRAQRGLKLRIADIYRKPGQGAADIMGEIKELTESDLGDFRTWFQEAGYPTA